MTTHHQSQVAMQTLNGLGAPWRDRQRGRCESQAPAILQGRETRAEYFGLLIGNSPHMGLPSRIPLLARRHSDQNLAAIDTRTYRLGVFRFAAQPARAPTCQEFVSK